MAQLEVLPAHVETLARIAHREIEQRLALHGSEDAAYWRAVATMYRLSPLLPERYRSHPLSTETRFGGQGL
jgi:hypothetical protein